MAAPKPGGYLWRAHLASIRHEAGEIGDALEGLIELASTRRDLVRVTRAATAVSRILADAYELERIAANEKAAAPGENRDDGHNTTTEEKHSR